MDKKPTSKIAGFLKKLEHSAKRDKSQSHSKQDKRSSSKKMVNSSSKVKLKVRSPSERVLVALGMINSAEGGSPKVHRRNKSRKLSIEQKDYKSKRNLIRKDTSSGSHKACLVESHSEPQFTDRVVYEKTKPAEVPGSQTERPMNIVNNFSLKFNQQESSSDSKHYEIADLKLNLQMKKMEASSLNQEVLSLKNALKRLEQDNLRMRQSLDDANYQNEKTVQKCRYYKSLVELKNEEILNLDSKLKALQRQTNSKSTVQSDKMNLANWGNSFAEAVSRVSITDTNKKSPSVPLQSMGINLSASEKAALTKTFYDLYECSSLITPQQVHQALSLIPESSSPRSPKEDPCPTSPKSDPNSQIPSISLKTSILLTFIMKTVKDDFELKSEAIKSLASVHQHYTNKMNHKLIDFRKSMEVAEDIIAQYEARLGAQMFSPLRDHSRRPSEVSNDTEILDNYIDEEEFDRLQSHQLESVSLIYHSSESQK